MFDGAAFGKEMVGIVRGYVERAMAPLLKRLDELEGRSVGITEDAARQMVADAVSKAIAEFPAPTPPAEPWRPTEDEILSLLQPMVDALPKPEDGKSITVEDVQPIIADQVSKAVSEIALPEPAEPSDDRLKALIVPIVDALPKPENGKSVTVDDVMPAIAEQVSKAVAALPVPKDGVGLAGAVIDRAGHLVVTLTDGSTKELGAVVGRDVDQAAVDAQIKDLVAALPKAQDGVDGLGFDDMSAEYDGERVIVLRFTRGEQVKEFAFKMPVVLDRGVWSEGKTYDAGDAVTWAGCVWIAQNDGVTTKPDGGEGWRLSVKRGRDGKSGTVRDTTPKPVKVF